MKKILVIYVILKFVELHVSISSFFPTITSGCCECKSWKCFCSFSTEIGNAANGIIKRIDQRRFSSAVCADSSFFQQPFSVFYTNSSSELSQINQSHTLSLRMTRILEIFRMRHFYFPPSLILISFLNCSVTSLETSLNNFQTNRNIPVRTWIWRDRFSSWRVCEFSFPTARI